MRKKLTEEEQNQLSDFIHSVARVVMDAMDEHMSEHIGHADPRIGANASALALAYCLAMNAPTNHDIESFMSDATAQAKDIAKETRPIVIARERLSRHGKPIDRERADRGVEQLINAMLTKSTVH